MAMMGTALKDVREGVNRPLKAIDAAPRCRFAGSSCPSKALRSEQACGVVTNLSAVVGLESTTPVVQSSPT